MSNGAYTEHHYTQKQTTSLCPSVIVKKQQSFATATHNLADCKEAEI
jgi:hypothetical protein